MSQVLNKIEMESVRYMIEKAGQNKSMLMDLSDPIQYNFLEAHLKRGGISSKNRPNLFKSIDNLRSKHIRYSKHKKSLAMHIKDTKDVQDDSVNSIAYMYTDDNSNYSSSAIISVEDGAQYTNISMGFYDIQGNPVSDVTAQEDFKNTTYNEVSVLNAKVKPDKQVFSVVSYYYEKDGKSFAIFENATTVPPWPKSMSVTNPYPVKHSGSSIIKFCMNRKGDDCDYEYKDKEGTVDIPFEGSITYSAPIDLDEDGRPKDAAYSINLIAVKRGGNAINPTSYDFFRDPNTKISGDTISWKIDTLKFENTKIHSGDGEEVQFVFSLQLSVAGNPFTSYITNKPMDQVPTKPGVLSLKAMQVVNGCLARGTEITMADKSLKKIEDIRVGEKVSTVDGNVLTVVNYFYGQEDTIIHIKDSDGREIHITREHAIPTVKGIKLAKELNTDDELITQAGNSKVVKAEEILYNDRVYNLELGTEDDVIELNDNNRTHYANGVLVGDSKMQNIHTGRFNAEGKNILEILPKEWHIDYQNYLKERKA